MEIKSILRKWQSEKGEIENIEELVTEMLKNIGTIDAELRDS